MRRPRGQGAGATVEVPDARHAPKLTNPGRLGVGEVNPDVAAILKASRPRKYHNAPTVVDGHRFDSKKEAERYGHLRMMEQAGVIRSLSLQVRYPLHAEGGKKIGVYVADFVYQEKIVNGWVNVVEDVKGVRTPMYKWKSRHMVAEYGIIIKET